VRVAVLGAGVVGVTAAWYLALDGHEVTVIDREPGAARETSFANGGQISVSHAEPWANPAAPRQILKWLGREDAPLLFRLHADWRQWRWAAAFLRECLPWRARRNTLACLALALYSHECLKSLRAATGIAYDHLERGILQFCTDPREFERETKAAQFMQRYGCDRVVKTAEECVAIEPALAACRDRLAGGIYTASDESGDAQRFTEELARLAATRGVRFRWNVDVRSVVVEGDVVQRLRCAHRTPRSAGRSRRGSITADAYVVACGSYSPRLLAPIGVPCLVYPAKGYSATINVGEHQGAPTVSLTDVERKLVISRLGNRLRVAGTAELDGYNTDLNRARCEAIIERTFELFPDAGERDSAALWTGLRPATPSNVPLIGPTRYRNLYLDTGHGTLGWTMACGSGRALADIIAGRKPAVDLALSAQARSR
jgi:D-amino-acid dehydrogenase